VHEHLLRLHVQHSRIETRHWDHPPVLGDTLDACNRVAFNHWKPYGFWTSSVSP